MLCLLSGWAIIGLLTFVNWWREKARSELGIWSFGLCIGAVGILLLALRGIVPNFWSVCVANSIVVVGIGYLWQGFRVFDGKRVHHLPIWSLGAVWFGFYFFCPGFAHDVNWRIILSSLVLGFELGMMALSIHGGHKTEPLPTRSVLVALLGVYTVMNLMRVPLSIVYPVQELENVATSVWYGVSTFVLHCISLLCGIGIFSLGRERLLFEYKHASETDVLTGIFNRRAFMERFNETVTHGGLLVLVDIDHFKRINDTFGHLGGDAVLSGFAHTVKTHITKDVVFGRFGGEEFALFLKGYRPDNGLALCEHLRQTTEHASFQWRDKKLSVTVSIGAHYVAPGRQDIESLLMDVDSALYCAKRGGRNRVVMYDANSTKCSAVRDIAEQVTVYPTAL